MKGVRSWICLTGALTFWTVSPSAAQTLTSGHVRPPEFAVLPAVDGGQVVQKPAGPAPTPRHTGVKAMFKDGRDFPVTVAAVPGGAAILYVRRARPASVERPS